MRPFHIGWDPTDRICRQVAQEGQPGSLMSQVHAVIRGNDNLDMAQREYILHAQTELQDHVAERIREYEAMLTVIGWVTGVVDPPPPLTSEGLRQQIMDAVVEAGGGLLDRSQRDSWVDDINPLNGIPVAIGIVYDISGGIAGLLGADELAADYDRTSERAYNTDLWSLYSNSVDVLAGYVIDGLRQYWDDFWEEVDTNGFLIAYGKLQIDSGFLAAELAIEIALSAVTGGAGGAVSRVIRVTGRRISRDVTEVTIRLSRAGEAVPDASTLFRHEVNDAEIPDDIERLMDEDNLGGADALEETAERADPNPDTPQTTQVEGEGGDLPPPVTRNPPLSAAERARLRRLTPNDELRDLVNEGQPIASELDPVPDPWLEGFERTARLEPDHIVPFHDIVSMDGFTDLSHANRMAILNDPDNFHGLSRSANGSRQNLSFEDWTMHRSSGTPVNPELRAQMIAEEARMREVLQQRIYNLLREQQNGSTPQLPFRDD
ncbi:hypothetical protein [Thalassococcus sp. S3]|uniref:hypothetical protein n=1 Tax=Thalassococcus sp. S3 TaxID=2017482 RepID=UPI0010246935|nr:hypothetical protein [Thalassococcus sp. S3]QBF33647.1 hypothetical protein CFI11_20865 [Thalassococcus sp. S3]